MYDKDYTFFRLTDIPAPVLQNSFGDNVNVEKRNKVTLSFHDLRYEVQQKVDDVPLCGKVASKEILCGIRYEPERQTSFLCFLLHFYLVFFQWSFTSRIERYNGTNGKR